MIVIIHGSPLTLIFDSAEKSKRLLKKWRIKIKLNNFSQMILRKNLF